MKDVSKRIKQMLETSKISQAGLAKAISVPKTTVNGWFRRNSGPSDTNVAKIANHFGVSIGYLRYGTEDRDCTVQDRNNYEKKYFPIYKAFAETVRFILEKALISAKKLPIPQSVQCRAKGLESLQRHLAQGGKLDTETLELERRDLAGVRLIFYTNNDVTAFWHRH